MENSSSDARTPASERQSASGGLRSLAELQAEVEALRAAAGRYRLLFEANPMPMWVYDRRTLRFLAVNEAAIRHYGYSRDEFLGMTIADIRPAEDVARVIGAVAQSPMELHRTGVWRHRRKDGRVFDVEIAAHPLEFEGHDAELVLAQDVTFQLRAETELRNTTELLRAVVDDSPLAIITVGLDLRITRWNPAAERLLGWSWNDIIGQSFLTIVPEDRREEHGEAREAVLRENVTRTFETKRRHRDGSLVDVSASLAALHGGQGAVEGFMVILSDIAERKRLESRLVRSQKMEAVGQLAGGIAHDFNNLLTAITSYTQFLLEDMSAGQPGHDDVLGIRAAAERAAALTRQLLAFSRQQVVQPRVLSLNTIVFELEKMLRRLVREDIAITLSLDPALGSVHADPGQIEQVLVNLVVNARDAMPDGGTITIETGHATFSEYSVRRRGEPTMKPGDYVVLSVSDTGTGMSEDVLARIFEPFFTTKEPGRGTGLGLATAYGIVGQSGGHISVYSEPGQGSSFKVLLPRIDQPITPASTDRVTKDAPRGSETILLVEDDDAVRAVTQRILRRCGYRVIHARNAADALRIIDEREPIDLVVTDMVMPGMNGPELAAHIRESHPHLGILFMSGYSRDAGNQLIRFPEGTRYLEKPFSPTALAIVVRELLDASAATAD